MAKQSDVIRIMLAEDHHVVRDAVAALLNKEADMRVVGEVADGKELAAEVARLQPDLLVMDAQMPHHQPVAAAKSLQQRFPQVRILVLSAYDLPEYVVGLLQAGVAGYVLKDDPSEMLVRAVRTIAQGDDWVSPQAAQILVESVRAQEGTAVTELTPREKDVLELVALGHRNQEIAAELVISEQTVKNHVSNIFSKLGVDTRVEAALYAIAHRLVSTESVRNEFRE